MSEAPGFGGAITTICAGGRYDGLVADLGGPETAGFGFALGIERAIITIEAEGAAIPMLNQIDAYVVGLGETTNIEALKLVQSIRQAGFSAERDFLNRKAKAQFKSANKLNARLVLTIGETELAEGTVNVKQMETRKEKTVLLEDIYTRFAEIYDELTEI